MQVLREYIRTLLAEIGLGDVSGSPNVVHGIPKTGGPSGSTKTLTLTLSDKADDEEDAPENLLTEPDENEDRDDIPADEFSGAGNIAGYTLPLGASNHPTSLRRRGDIAGQGFGGARPVKKKKDL